MSTWRDNVRKVIPYTPGEQPKEKNVIKLNTNENPYPPSPKVKEVMDSFDTSVLRKYPDPAVKDLVHALAARYGVADDQVFVGVGSDDVISMCFLTFFAGGKNVLFPDVTYSFYDVWASVYGVPYKTVALDADFRINPADYAVENGGIIFPNPNAPTGVEESLDTIRAILDANKDSVVIVDEAYVDFGAASALPLVKEYENLLVVQTFSKSRQMAGMRIGYSIGSPELIKYLNDVKYSVNSYTMNSLQIATGVAAVEDEAYFEECCAKIMATRERSEKELSKLGFTFPKSSANFIFATHETVPAADIFAALKEAGIYVRYFNKPRIDNYLRITVGTDEEMDGLFEFLAKYLEDK
ncbi:MAG: histidinol-phosphate transaminase [Eubacterium sp.]|nr:histidinol-phosphate transaminase [Eubacterium sp.]